jgi:hypothetical protein
MSFIQLVPEAHTLMTHLTLEQNASHAYTPANNRILVSQRVQTNTYIHAKYYSAWLLCFR